MVGYPKLGDKYYGMGIRTANGDPEHHCAGCNCNRQMWTIPMNPRTPHLCPKCKGQKVVQTPPWVAGDQLDNFPTGGIGTYPCGVCDGEGVIWE